MKTVAPLSRRHVFAWVLVALLAAASCVCADINAGRIAAVTCCERSEDAWTVLRSWQRSCAKASARAGLSVEKYASMLSLLARRTVTASVMTSVCHDEGLSGQAILAYFHHALCASLPGTHTDLARSVYSPLLDDAPDREDDITGEMERVCRGLQLRWSAEVAVWQAQLSTQPELSAAQLALCPTPCRWTEDPIDGGQYDL